MVRIKKGLEDIVLDNPPYVVYMLECEGGRVYVGYTNDLFRRMKEHESGKGAEFTEMFPPKRIFYLHPYDTREEALKAENELTLYCILKLKNFSQVAGGDYAQIFKSPKRRREIIKKIKASQLSL